MIADPFPMEHAHDRALDLLDGAQNAPETLILPGGARVSGVELIARTALDVLVRAGYVGPARTVLEWAAARPDDEAWDTATDQARVYLRIEIKSPFGMPGTIEEEAVRHVCATHGLTRMRLDGI